MRKIFTLIFLLSCCQIFGQANLPVRLSLVKQMVESQHVQPRKIDDAFSSDLFDVFITSLDPQSLYFTKQELNALEKYRLTLDDEIAASKTEFFNEVLKLYKAKLTVSVATINKICSTPFSFTADEYFDYGSDSVRAASEKELYQKWYLLLKEEVLNDLVDMARSRLASGSPLVRQEILQKEPEF